LGSERRKEETEGPIISPLGPPGGTIMLFKNRGLTEAPSGVYLISRNIYLAKEDPNDRCSKEVSLTGPAAWKRPASSKARNKA